MKKTKVLTAAVAALGVLSLASCGGNEEKSKYADLKDDLTKSVQLNLDVQYAGSSTISNAKEAYTDIEGNNINKGDLLPMWQEVEKIFNIDITDGSHAQSQDDKEYQTLMTTNKGKGSNGKNVVLFNNTLTNITTMARAGQAIPLDELAHLMPNFQKYLKANPAIAKQLTIDGHIYATPYFDGSDTIEHMYQLNHRWVQLLLDGQTSAHNDTPTAYPATEEAAKSDKQGATVYTPFYGAIDTTIKVVNPTETGLQDFKLTIPADKNIIKQFNDLGADATGYDLVMALRAYIDEVYGSQIGEGKVWKKRSDLFTSTAATYNADELVALMRCVKLNTFALTGQEEKKVVVMAPRGTADNRYVNILHLSSMFGARGLTSSAESNQFYLDKDGKLHDARTEKVNYDALEQLHKLYQEGLILNNFKDGVGGKTGGTIYRDNYLAKGLQFMVYDYSASISEVDATYEFKSRVDNDLKDFGAVVSPLAQWHAEGANDNSFTRFHESSRALKNGGWCILSTATNEEIARSATLMDYFFCPEGADLQDFGPNREAYRKAVTQYDTNGNRKEGAGTMKLADGSLAVVIGDKAKAAIGTYGSWTNFYRQRVGATFPIGHIRSDALDLQVTAPGSAAQKAKVDKAIALGAMIICTSGASNSFYRQVPTTWDISSSIKTQIDNDTKVLGDLWKQAGGYQNIIMYGFGSTAEGKTTKTRAEFEALFKASNEGYLVQYQRVYDRDHK